MKAIINKALSSILAAGMLLSMGSHVIAAGNYEDSYFYNFKVSTETRYTTPRPKLDDTSSTVKLSRAAVGVVVRVYGSKTADGKKVDRTAGTPCIVGASNTYTYLPNFVYENGDGYACLGFIRSGVTNVTIDGAWSPDSI